MENTEEQKSISIEKKSEKELENYRESLDQAYTKLEYSTHFLSYLEPYITDLDLAISGKLPKEKEELFVNFLSLAGRRILKKYKINDEYAETVNQFLQKCLLYASVRIQNQDPPLTLLHLVAKIFVQPHSFGFYEDHIGEKIMNEVSTEPLDEENSNKNKEENSVDVEDETNTLENENQNEKENKQEKGTEEKEEEEEIVKDELGNNESQKGTEITESTTKIDLDPEIVKDKNSFYFTSNYLMDNIKYFAELNGFKNLLLLILSTKYEITLFNVKRILKPVEHGTLYLTSDYSENFLPLINKIFEKIYNLEFERIRQIEKEKLKKIVSYLTIIAHRINRDQYYILSESFELNFGFKELQSPILEQRVNGIERITEIAKNALKEKRKIVTTHAIIYHPVKKNKYFKIKKLIDWFEEKNIINILFGENMHLEIINRCEPILVALAKKKCITKQHLDQIWSDLKGIHHLFLTNIYSLIVKISQYLDKELLEYILIEKINKIPKLNEAAINMIAEFTLSTMHEFPEIIEKMWGLCLNPTINGENRKILIKHWNRIVDNIKFHYKLKTQYIRKCIFHLISINENEDQNGTIILPILESLMFTLINKKDKWSYRNYVRTVQTKLDKLEQKYNLLNLLCTELINYKKQIKVQIAKEKMDLTLRPNEYWVNYKFFDQLPYLESIKLRLNLLKRFLNCFDEYDIKTKHFFLKYEHFDQIWESIADNSIILEEKDFFFEWIIQVNLKNKLENKIFEKKIQLLNIKEMTKKSFEFFKYYCYKANYKKGNIHGFIEKFTLTQTSIDKILGVNTIWDIVLKVIDEDVANLAISFLLQLSIPSNYSTNHSKSVKSLIGKTISMLEKSKETDQKIIRRCIEILFYLVKKIESKMIPETFQFKRHINTLFNRKVKLFIEPREFALNKNEGIKFSLEFNQYNSIIYVKNQIVNKLNANLANVKLYTNNQYFDEENMYKTLADLNVPDILSISYLIMKSNDNNGNENKGVDLDEKIENNIVPSYILSNYFETFFSLFEIGNYELHEKIWELFLLMPTNQKQKQILKNIFNNDNDNSGLIKENENENEKGKVKDNLIGDDVGKKIEIEINNDDINKKENINLNINWEKVLNFNFIFKFIYKLEIILGIILSQKKESMKWKINFINSKGSLFLINLLNKIYKLNNYSKKIKRDCINLILQIINEISKGGNGIEKTIESSKINSFFILLMDLISIVSKEKVDQEENTDNEDNNLILINKEIIRNSIEIIISGCNSVLINNNWIISLKKFENLKEWFLNSLIETNNYYIAKIIRNGFLKISKNYLNNKLNVELNLINHLLNILLSLFNKVNKVSKGLKYYFELCSGLIELNYKSITNNDINENSKNDENKINYDELFEILIKKIKSTPIVEKWGDNNEPDRVMIGYLNLLSILFKYEDKYKELINNENYNLINEFWNICLFQFPTIKDFPDINQKGNELKFTPIKKTKNEKLLLPKTKENLTRRAIYNCLIELTKNNSKNFLIVSNLIKIQQKNLILPDTWHYNPRLNSKSKLNYLGLRNLGATCYLNSVLQQLFMIPEFRKKILSTPFEKNSQLPLYQLQKLFCNLLWNEKKFADPEDFCKSFIGYDGQPINPRIQQDADEFFNILFQKLENNLKEINYKENYLYDLFGGKLVNQIIGLKETQVKSERLENFFVLSLPIIKGKKIEDSLSKYIEGDRLEGENQYYSEKLGKKIDALKRVCIHTLPKNLFLHLKRFEWNFNDMQRYKVNDVCSFPFKLNMKPYTKDGIENTNGNNNDQDDEDDDKDDDKEENKSINKNYDYELKGIIVHTGTCRSGHYYSFIQERELKKKENKRWLRFDDRNISLFDSKNIPDECFGGINPNIKIDMYNQSNEKPYSGYMLLYQRIDELEDDNGNNGDNNIENEKQVIINEDEIENKKIEQKDQIETKIKIEIGKKIEKKKKEKRNFTTKEKEEILQKKEISQKEDNTLKRDNVSDKQIEPKKQIELNYKHIYKEIWENNLNFRYHSVIFNPDYYNFIFSIVETINSFTTNVTEEFYLAGFKILINFIYKILFHSSEKKNFLQWQQLIKLFLNNSNSCCDYFLIELTKEPNNWITEFLYECPDSSLWKSLCPIFLEIIKNGLKLKKERENLIEDLEKIKINNLIFETELDYTEGNSTSFPYSYQRLLKQFDYNQSTKQIKINSYIIKILNNLLSILNFPNKISNEIFDFLIDCIEIDPLIVQYFLNNNLISKFIDFYLEEHSPLRVDKSLSSTNIDSSGGWYYQYSQVSSYNSSAIEDLNRIRLSGLVALIEKIISHCWVHDPDLIIEMKNSKKSIDQNISLQKNEKLKIDKKINQINKTVLQHQFSLEEQNKLLENLINGSDNDNEKSNNENEKYEIKEDKNDDKIRKIKDNIKHYNELCAISLSQKFNLEEKLNEKINLINNLEKKILELEKEILKFDQELIIPNTIHPKIHSLLNNDKYGDNNEEKNGNENYINKEKENEKENENKIEIENELKTQNIEKIKGQILKFSKLDRLMLIRSGFFIKAMTSDLNSGSLGKLFLHLCWENMPLFKRLIGNITTNIERKLSSQFGRYYSILSSLLKIKDSQQNEKINYAMSRLIQTLKKNQHSERDSSTSLLYIRELADQDIKISQWLINEKENWLIIFLIKNRNQSIRMRTCSLIRALISPQNYLMSLQFAKNKKIDINNLDFKNIDLKNVDGKILNQINDNTEKIYLHLLNELINYNNFIKREENSNTTSTTVGNPNYPKSADFYKFTDYFELLEYILEQNEEKKEQRALQFNDYFEYFWNFLIHNDNKKLVCNQNLKSALSFWEKIITSLNGLNTLRTITESEEKSKRLLQFSIKLLTGQRIILFNRVWLRLYINIIKGCCQISSIFNNLFQNSERFIFFLKNLSFASNDYPKISDGLTTLFKQFSKNNVEFKQKYFKEIIQPENFYNNPDSTNRIITRMITNKQDLNNFLELGSLHTFTQIIITDLIQLNNDSESSSNSSSSSSSSSSSISQRTKNQKLDLVAMIINIFQYKFFNWINLNDKSDLLLIKNWLNKDELLTLIIEFSLQYYADKYEKQIQNLLSFSINWLLPFVDLNIIEKCLLILIKENNTLYDYYASKIGYHNLNGNYLYLYKLKEFQNLEMNLLKKYFDNFSSSSIQKNDKISKINQSREDIEIEKSNEIDQKKEINENDENIDENDQNGNDDDDNDENEKDDKEKDDKEKDDKEKDDKEKDEKDEREKDEKEKDEKENEYNIGIKFIFLKVQQNHYRIIPIIQYFNILCKFLQENNDRIEKIVLNESFPMLIKEVFKNIEKEETNSDFSTFCNLISKNLNEYQLIQFTKESLKPRLKNIWYSMSYNDHFTQCLISFKIIFSFENLKLLIIRLEGDFNYSLNSLFKKKHRFNKQQSELVEEILKLTNNILKK
ncbi:ubiquitin carboxyl-terminal hydrolase faf-y-related [Anaeramoeba flamelloides]|uniref:Ubiquitin carboxyl-terminal hydrolase faf-y-related n=1 Tax=Anaeramoeba flamelloides TaxID=1746091 RepID=A0ABQ8Z415_9EUKA|nr:ubiquitin carboxyl-terminal hydrolase faf-y-related [Anaeramoeba flamelloides]